MSVLHFAATFPDPKDTQTVRRALGKGNAANRGPFLPEQVAVMHGNKESVKILREWAINYGSSLRVLFASRSHRLSQCFRRHFFHWLKKKHQRI